MNIKVEMPEGLVLLNKNDLKETLQEILKDVQNDNCNEEIMTIKEVAEYLKVSVQTVRNLIAKKEIPFFQNGQVIRLNRRDIEKWIRFNSKIEGARGGEIGGEI